MRIVQIHNRYKNLGGEDTVLQNEYRLLKDAGHEVFQFFFDNAKQDTTLKKLNIALQLPYSFPSKRRLRAYLKEIKPDVVHVHNFLPVATASIFYACKSLNLPVILTLHNFRLLCVNGLFFREGKVCEKCISKTWPVHGVRHSCYQNSKLASFFTMSANGFHNTVDTWNKKIDKFIFLTPLSKEIFNRSKLTLKEEKQVIKPNFVEDRGYSLDKEDYYLFVGRLSREKGVHLILENFTKSKRIIKIVGDGPMATEVKEAATRHSNIYYEGFLPQNKIAPLYKHARALLFTSIWHETMGMVIAEAYSFGTPVIGTTISTAKALISEGFNGMCFNAHEPLSFENTLTKFEADTQTSWAKNARQTYEEHYTPAKNLVLLEQIYKEAINNKSV